MLLIKHGILLTMTDRDHKSGDILIDHGKIIDIRDQINESDIYQNNNIEKTLRIIDATNCLVLPGLIESHCHVGIANEKKGITGDDSNESTSPVTPYLRALDGINPMDSAFHDAMQAGITSIMVGPGSANVVGGQFLLVKTTGRNIDQMVILEPAAMKIAFGENPKTSYGNQNKMPATRMAIAAMIREELFNASEYKKKRDMRNGTDTTKDFSFNFKLEHWLPVLNKEIPIKAHVHRADDILTAIRIAKEFDLDLTLDHCTEGHLIASDIAASGFPAIVGPALTSKDKMEIQYMSFKTADILAKAGVDVAITTDHPVNLIQTLPICAGFAAKAGLGKEEALRAITINAARICRISNRVGSLEIGKDADIAIFDGNPMEVFTNCLYTIIDGKVVFDKALDAKSR